MKERETQPSSIKKLNIFSSPSCAANKKGVCPFLLHRFHKGNCWDEGADFSSFVSFPSDLVAIKNEIIELCEDMAYEKQQQTGKQMTHTQMLWDSIKQNAERKKQKQNNKNWILLWPNDNCLLFSKKKRHRLIEAKIYGTCTDTDKTMKSYNKSQRRKDDVSTFFNITNRPISTGEGLMEQFGSIGTTQRVHQNTNLRSKEAYFSAWRATHCCLMNVYIFFFFCMTMRCYWDAWKHNRKKQLGSKWWKHGLIRRNTYRQYRFS